MPTYDYACRDCGHRFDAVQSIHDDALTECPECGGSLRRVVGAVGVQFKGSGFYMTDNRGKAPSTPKSAGSDSTAKADGKDTATKTTAESKGDGGSASTKAPAKSSGGSSSSDGS